jgi:hypothetical protein
MKDEEINLHLKRDAVAAYAEGVARMLARVSDEEMDEAQIEMIKEGITQTLLPTLPKPAVFISPPSAPARPTISNFFRHKSEKGITVYHWPFIVQQATHYHRELDTAHVVLYFGEEVLLRLIDAPAIAFWKWQEQVMKDTPSDGDDEEVEVG